MKICVRHVLGDALSDKLLFQFLWISWIFLFRQAGRQWIFVSFDIAVVVFVDLLNFVFRQTTDILHSSACPSNMPL